MDIRAWVSDNTIKFLGAVDSTVVDYIIAEAQSAKSPDLLYNKLSGVGFPSGTSGKEFAENLFVKVPRQRKHALTTEKKAKQKETTAFIQQNSSYKLILEPEEETPVAPVRKEKKDKKEKKSKTRRRDDGDDQWESDEEDKRVRKRRREEYEEEQRAKYEATLNEEEQEDLKRQDERERDEFAEKMKEKDKASQQKVPFGSRSSTYRQVVEDRSSEARNRRNLADDAEGRVEALKELRIESRQQYLVKRQAQQLELLKQQVHEDESMWSTQRLTKKEMEDIQQRKRALQIALERQNIDDGFDGYAMPDEYFTKQGKIDKKRREEVLTKRLVPR